jgi:hypothetical protein
MSRVPLQSFLLATILVASIVIPGRAFAQGTTGTVSLGTGGTVGTVQQLAPTDFNVYFEQNLRGLDSQIDNWVQMNTTDAQYFFNRARCECDKDPRAAVKIAIVPTAAAVSKISNLLQSGPSGGGALKIYAGGTAIDCLSTSTQTFNIKSYCTNLLNPANYDENRPMTVFTLGGSRWESDPIPVAWLFGSVNTSSDATCGSKGTCDNISDCSSASQSVVIYIWMQTAVGSTPDSGMASFRTSLTTVGQVLNAPSDVSVLGGNNALTVDWKWPTYYSPSTDSTFKGVHVFCERAADATSFTQVFADRSFGASYQTAATICGDSAPAATADVPFARFNPNSLCSGLIPPTQNSYRIKNLQNGILYRVGVAAVDRYGNISAIDPSSIQYGYPIPTADFYGVYKTDNGAATGGFCTVAKAASQRSAVILVGLVGLGLLIVVRRRTRRGPPGPGTLVVLVAAAGLLAGPARAQNFDHDSSFVEDRSEGEPWHGSARQFAIEARFGLYTPNVDSEFSGKHAPAPNALIFGTKRRPMWQLEFDWEILQVFGTLSLGGSIGYYKENGSACDLNTSNLKADPPKCVASGDNTSLRLIPLAALVVYRLDAAVERWNIPLVPYAKVGLNYTIWTVTDGNGDVASANGDKGQGGTPGWQAAVGISLLLDFLDPSAARGFDADSGVNHSYAFFELDHIDGSGLYRKDVLRVGDNTWFAGLMFEF